jgi:hypothetical protein
VVGVQQPENPALLLVLSALRQAQWPQPQSQPPF